MLHFGDTREAPLPPCASQAWHTLEGTQVTRLHQGCKWPAVGGCDIQGSFKTRRAQDQGGSTVQRVRWVLTTGHVTWKFTSLGLNYFTFKVTVS